MLKHICGSCGEESNRSTHCNMCDSTFLNDAATKGTYTIILNRKSVAIEGVYLTDRETLHKLAIEKMLDKFPEFEKREPETTTLDEEQPLYSIREVWDLTVDFKYSTLLKDLAKNFNREQKFSYLNKFLQELSTSVK